jgi:DNA (cytosine-5)-methyltransferase 1
MNESATAMDGAATRRRLRDLRTLILSTTTSSAVRTSAVRRDEAVREAATRIATRLSLNFERYWRASNRAPEGPIDVIDMFSGCGGMSAGFRAANGLLPAYRLALAVDIDPVANRSYARNLVLEPVEHDIAELARDPHELDRLVASSRRRPGHPLVMIGCAPCQGFSSHRNSSGQRDRRNPLFVEFAMVAARLRPDAVIVENVPELLTDRYWSYVQQAQTILAAAGYHTYLGVHNMAEFGVPQERFRALMLALPKRFRPPRGFLPRKRFRTVRQAIGRLPSIIAGERDPTDPMHYTAGHRESTLEVIRAVPRDGGNRPPGVGPPCLERARVRQGRGAYDDVYGRLRWDSPAITVTAYSRNPASGRFVHPVQDRGLSVREAALLQSFPRDYWFEGTLDERFRQIGNAVPPAFAGFVAVSTLAELLTTNPSEEFTPGVARPVGRSFSRLIPALKAGTVSADLCPAVR